MSLNRRKCDRCSQPLLVGIDSQLIDNPLQNSEGEYSEEKLVLWRCSRCLEEYIE